jgi:hypothetical protein
MRRRLELRLFRLPLWLLLLRCLRRALLLLVWLARCWSSRRCRCR